MKNSRALIEEIGKLSWLAEKLEAELSVLDCCRKTGLDYDEASDYALAVRELLKENNDDNQARAVQKGESETAVLHYSNPVANQTDGRYNGKIKGNLTTEIPDEVFYSFWDTVRKIGRGIRNTWEETKDKVIQSKPVQVLREPLSRRVIKNNTRETIDIFGVPRANPNVTIKASLGPGSSSAGAFKDAEAVVIRRGQKFFKSKDEMGKKNGVIVTEGVIKVPGGMTVAEVAPSRNDPKVFYVNSYDTEYMTRIGCPTNWPCQ